MMLTLMVKKTIGVRRLRPGAPEEALSSGEALRVKKRDGETFELRRVDSVVPDILANLDRIREEIPATDPAHPANLARMVVENRE